MDTVAVERLGPREAHVCIVGEKMHVNAALALEADLEGHNREQHTLNVESPSHNVEALSLVPLGRAMGCAIFGSRRVD